MLLSFSLRRMGRGNGGGGSWGVLMCLHENHFKLLILALSMLCHCQLLCLVFLFSHEDRKESRLELWPPLPGLDSFSLASFSLAMVPSTAFTCCVSVALLLFFFCFFFQLSLLLNFFRVIFWNWHLVCDERDLQRVREKETHLDWAACWAVSFARSLPP